MRHTAYLTFAFLSLVTLSGTETVRRHDKYCAAQMGTPVYGPRRTSSRFIDVDNRGVNRLQNHQTALVAIVCLIVLNVNICSERSLQLETNHLLSGINSSLHAFFICYYDQESVHFGEYLPLE